MHCGRGTSRGEARRGLGDGREKGESVVLVCVGARP